MSSEKQYFDRLEEEYSKQYGHQLFAIDDIENTKLSLDVDDPWRVSSKNGEIQLVKTGMYPLTLRAKFDTEEALKNKEDELFQLINNVHVKENSIHLPTSKYRRNL